VSHFTIDASSFTSTECRLRLGLDTDTEGSGVDTFVFSFFSLFFFQKTIFVPPKWPDIASRLARSV
jgi:hypothetical protein